MAPPRSNGAVYAWTLEEIFNARDAQIRGQFSLPARLAVSMRTNAAIGVARRGRLAPQKCIKTEVVPAKGAGSGSIQNEADAIYGEAGVAVSAGTRADIEGCLVDHGVAFGFNTWTAREDGTRTDVVVSYWPIEHVRWDAHLRCYVTRVDPSVMPEDGAATIGMGEVPIVHGDGRWIIFALSEDEPHKQDAALLDAAIVWATNAFANRDWAKSSVAHGNVKMIGTMPEGSALQDADGDTPEATAMIALMRGMISGDDPAGLLPNGADAKFVGPVGTNYQVFSELVLSSERLAARIYLGTDGTLGSNGGAPGVDIGELFGVATTKVQGDLGAISRGLQTGSIEIWTAINFGSSEKAPTHRYMIPDADADADKASLGVRRQAFYADIDAAKKAGAVVDQVFVDAVAAQYDVEPFTVKVVAPVAPPPALLAAATALAVRGFDAEALSMTLSAAQAPTVALVARNTDAIEQLSLVLSGIATVRGKDGTDGFDGADGAQGTEGPQGLPGVRGAMGAVGPVGPRGKDGAKAEALTGAESYAHFTATLVELRKLGAKLTPDMVRAVAERHGVTAPELEAAE
jgi:hypothetical protein